MATAIRAGVMSESPSDPYAWPAFDAMEDKVAEARCATGAALHAARRVAADAMSMVRRHPLRALGVALAAGVVAGSLVGLGAGWAGRFRA
jgi:hypothetical protein